MAECYGGDRQVELEDIYSGRRTPYSLTGPLAQCNAEGWLPSFLAHLQCGLGIDS